MVPLRRQSFRSGIILNFSPSSNLNLHSYWSLGSLQAEEALHAQIAKSKPNLAPLQSPDLLDDAELLAEDRELDAELTGMMNSPVMEQPLSWWAIVHRSSQSE